MEQAATTDGLLALPEAGAQGEEGMQTLMVGGLPVKLDHLGPMVINSDGTVQSSDCEGRLHGCMVGIPYNELA